jgi:kynurenine formamidase
MKGGLKMSTKIYDLSQPFGRNTPLWPWPTMTDVEIKRVSYWERDRFPGGCKKYTTVVTTKFHASTHMDAAAHVIDNGEFIDQVPLEKCYGTGVIVDFRYMQKWHVISPEDLENAKPKIEPGDFVVFNTGWHKYWKKDNYVYFNHYPSLYKEGAEWLLEKKIKALAIDGGAIDTPLAHAPLAKNAPWLRDEYVAETGRDPDEEYPIYEPAHMILLGNGIPGIENAGGDIDEVTGKRVTLAAFPIRYEEGDASIVRLVAIVDE